MTARRVAVAVVVHAGHVLVGRRSAAAADAASHDEFPGGLVEPGEGAEEAAARECREEAGIRIVVEGLIATAGAPSSRGPIEIHFFRCRPVGGETPRAPFAWTPIGALEPDRFPRPNAPVIASLRTADG